MVASRQFARVPGEAERYRLTLETDLSIVGDIVDLVCLRCFGTEPVSGRTRFRLCTVLAEAVANAMLYGNGSDPERHVEIELALDVDQVVIGVRDEGSGFDHTIVPFPIGDESRDAVRGRGLFMIHRLADAVTFNDAGNAIWMTLPRR